MVHKIRTGISRRDLPERYGPWKTVYTRVRRYAPDGVFTRALQQIQAHAEAVGDIDWLVQTDSSAPTSTPPRQGDKRASPSERTERSRPRSISRRTDDQSPSRLRRKRTSARDHADTRPAPRQHLSTPSPGTHQGPTRRPRTARLQT
ncbi:transposase [Streptomyces sp. NPDC006285]|uniref:transposase n=1 Tax=Streptomyces sp. NPDC006285 TaxID=3364742 RepID=UPI0036B31A29